VAAYFATHALTELGYRVRAEESGVVYRWPVLRRSALRLEIPTSSDRQEAEPITAVDLSQINEHFRRPRSQAAVLATPATASAIETILRSGLFEFSPEELRVVDMVELPSCESFELPPSAGEELSRIEGASMDGLFPDRIDLGHSYLSAIGLLSMIVHHPDDLVIPFWDEPTSQEFRDHFERGIRAACAILDRECLRLVPDYPPGLPHEHMPLLEAAMTISTLTRESILAAKHSKSLVKDSEVKEHQRKELASLLAQYKARREAFQDTRDEGGRATPETGPEELDPMAVSIMSPGDEWIIPEVERRFRIVEKIISDSGKVPVYALLRPEQ
jgi:hypothetical protein